MGNFRHSLNVRAFIIQRLDLYYLKIWFFRIFHLLNHWASISPLEKILVLRCHHRTVKGMQIFRVMGISAAWWGPISILHEELMSAVAEDKTGETGRSQIVKNLWCQVRGFELFLKAKGNLSSKWLAFRKISLTAPWNTDWVGASLATGKSVKDAITLNWANSEESLNEDSNCRHGEDELEDDKKREHLQMQGLVVHESDINK